MRALAAPTPQRSVTLRRHFISIVPRLLFGALVGAALLGTALLLRQAGLMLAGILVAGLIIAREIAAWRTFTISVRYDRVRIRYFRIGIRQITYPIPGLRGLTCEQHPIGMLWDVGTLILTLPDRTLRFTMLTPYSSLNAALGW